MDEIGPSRHMENQPPDNTSDHESINANQPPPFHPMQPPVCENPTVGLRPTNTHNIWPLGNNPAPYPLRPFNLQTEPIPVCAGMPPQNVYQPYYLPTERTLREYMHPVMENKPSPIPWPYNQERTFSIKPNMIREIPSFLGMESENPYYHVSEFESICRLFAEGNASVDTVCLKLFSFSLKDKAKTWYNNLPAFSVRNWQQMKQVFFEKFFPASRTMAIQQQIQNFRLKPNETFYTAWERFKDLQVACPHHGHEPWQLVKFFYYPLPPQMKQLISSMCPGDFQSRNATEALAFFEQLADDVKSWEINPQTADTRNSSTVPGMYFLNEPQNYETNYPPPNLTVYDQQPIEDVYYAQNN